MNETETQTDTLSAPPETAAPPPRKTVEDRLLLRIPVLGAYALHHPECQEKMARLLDNSNALATGLYLQGDSTGQGGTRWQDEARLYRVSTVLERWNYLRDYLLVDLVDEELARAVHAEPYRHCCATEVLSGALVRSLTVAPQHPVYRSLLMASVGEMPPDTLTTVDALLHWVEQRYQPDLLRFWRNARQFGNVGTPPEAAALAPETRIPHALRVSLHYSDMEHGRCNYSVRRFGNGEMRFTEDQVRQWVATGLSLTQMMACIEEERRAILEDFDENLEQSEEPDDWNYTHMNSEDHDGLEVTFSQTAVARMCNLTAFLQGLLSQEQLVRLGIAPEA